MILFCNNKKIKVKIVYEFMSTLCIQNPNETILFKESVKDFMKQICERDFMKLFYETIDRINNCEMETLGVI